ncbi:MAG: tRNA (adenosine(37)-N6)-threonylcarbamoyltransferase complex dimerization subunit type 1 TsaB [Bacteroidales bacterium]|nr:tRNA (adenosine(37)-N6)-threonylcarbamoyltransferase complex dimerization subunit type 1 TsaB [Bacteroidales bacterium]
MTILLLETATEVCSTAIVRDGQLLCQRRSTEPNAHSSLLAVFVDQMLVEAGLGPSSLDAVCVSAGPGSYTGLRIGVSTAKGLCYGLQIPLLSVPTLRSMAALYYEQHPDYGGRVCPMLDARRMECYTAFFARTADGVEQLAETSADVIVEGLYDNWLDSGEVTFIGPGAAKTQPLLSRHPNARFDTTFALSAMGMAAEAERALREGRVEDVAYFEPLYLKDFVAKKAAVRGLFKNQ